MKIISAMLAVLLLTSCGQATVMPETSGTTPSKQQASVQPQTDYQEQYYERYELDKLFNNFILISNWQDAAEIEPANLTMWYLETQGEALGLGDKWEMAIPQQTLEAGVQAHFAVTPEQLRQSEHYRAAQQDYYFDNWGWGGGASCNVVGARQDGDTVTVIYEFVSGEDGSVLRTGELDIELGDGDNAYRYIACRTQSTAK